MYNRANYYLQNVTVHMYLSLSISILVLIAVLVIENLFPVGRPVEAK